MCKESVRGVADERLLNLNIAKKMEKQQLKIQAAFFRASRNCIKSSLTTGFGCIVRVNFPWG